MLNNAVFKARAKGLALTAQPITAAQAADWGLIWKAVPDDTLMEEATALAAGLGAAHRVHRTPGNFNNHLGTPLTLLATPADCEMAVVEVAMRSAQRAST